LSVKNGYKAGTLQQALRRRYPAAQEIIAAAIGVNAEEIWPDRYTGGKESR
jgi:Ner family transcriptional regulator